jgi:hypothetical protein
MFALVLFPVSHIYVGFNHPTVFNEVVGKIKVAGVIERWFGGKLRDNEFGSIPLPVYSYRAEDSGRALISPQEP